MLFSESGEERAGIARSFVAEGVAAGGLAVFAGTGGGSATGAELDRGGAGAAGGCVLAAHETSSATDGTTKASRYGDVARCAMFDPCPFELAKPPGGCEPEVLIITPRLGEWARASPVSGVFYFADPRRQVGSTTIDTTDECGRSQPARARVTHLFHERIAARSFATVDTG
jgi:hypothetical protein